MRIGPSLLSVLLLLVPAGLGAQGDEKLAGRVAKADEKLVRAFSKLAREYDEAKDPEACHFLASCAVGFGSKDTKDALLKGAWELDVYLGKVRGGKVQEKLNPIRRELEPLAKEYKAIYDALHGTAKRGGLPEAEKKLLHQVLVRYELARGAHEYIPAVQRFNELRRAMGLRAVLWDFEASSKLVLACWYMAETGDDGAEDRSDASSIYYSEWVELCKQECSRLVFNKLADVPSILRPYALIRQDVMNPNSRSLRLAHWSGGKEIDPLTVYDLPELPYREDIPTPGTVYADTKKTVDGWVETEQTIVLNGSKCPVSYYPYDGEPDAPWCFSNGQGAMENCWVKAEHEFLGRAGVPIMLRLFWKGAPKEANVSLKTSSGAAVPVRLYTNGDSRVTMNGEWATLLLLPEKQLEKGTKHTVSIRCLLGETAFEKSWTFTTRRN